MKVKSDIELEYMRSAGKVVANTLAMIEKVIKPGITTGELDKPVSYTHLTLPTTILV